MPLKGERRKAHDRERDKRRRREHRERTGTNLRTDRPKPNEFGATPIDLLAPDVLDHVARLASQSVPHSLIAKCLGMTLPAFRKHCEAHPEFQEALDVGGAMEELHLVNNLRAVADDADNPGSIAANIFLLKARRQYSDRPDKVRVLNQQNNFFTQLPTQQSMDDYVRSLPAATPVLPAKEST